MENIQLFLLACACSLSLAEIVPTFPDFMQIQRQYLSPDGLAWDNTRSRFILGDTNPAQPITYFSQSEVNVTSTGSTGLVNLKTLVEKAKLQPDSGVFGLSLDDDNNRLWACNTNFGAIANSTYMAGISLIKLSTGTVLKNVDMTSLRNAATAGDRAMFVLDAAVAPDGNAYATNSYDGQVFKITPAGEATVFAASTLLAPATTAAYGLSGIVVKENYLLVGKVRKSRSALDVSSLYKISLSDPKSVSEVTISGGPVRYGLDGMVMDNTKTYLYIVNYYAGLIYTLKSDDDWKTATVLNATAVPKQCVGPTTAVFLTNPSIKGVWVSCSSNFTSGPYAVQRVRGVPLPPSSKGSSGVRASCDLFFITLFPLLLFFFSA